MFSSMTLWLTILKKNIFFTGNIEVEIKSQHGLKIIIVIHDWWNHVIPIIKFKLERRTSWFYFKFTCTRCTNSSITFSVLLSLYLPHKIVLFILYFSLWIILQTFYHSMLLVLLYDRTDDDMCLNFVFSHIFYF